MKNRKKRRISPGKAILIGCVLLVVVVLTQHFAVELWGGDTQYWQFVYTDVRLEYSFDTMASFYAFGNSFLFVARDGVQNLSIDGDVLWQHGFNMSSPITVGRGGVAAVGDSNGKEIHVFNATGLLYSVNLPQPILYFTVNATGYLSVIMSTETGYLLQVYDAENFQIPIYHALMGEINVFPFSVDVSDCGALITMARLDTSGLISSHISFSYLRRIAESRRWQDGMFRSYRFDNEFTLHTRFVNCMQMIALTDQRIIGYNSEEGNHGYEWSIPLHNRPDLFQVGENFFAFVSGEPFLNDFEADSPGILFIYDFNGQLILRHDLGRRATHLSIAHGTLLIGLDRDFLAINTQGMILWNHTAIQDINNATFLNNTNTILLATNTQATIMQRTR